MSERNYGALREASAVETLTERMIQSGKPFGFDIEAGYVGEDQEKVALKQFHPDYRVTGMSFAGDVSWGRYVPFDHDNGGNVDDLVATARALWKLLNTGLGVAHNASYELKGMSRWFREVLWNDPEVGADVRRTGGLFPILADTMLMAWLAAEYDPIKIGKDLKSLAKAAFGLEMDTFESLFPYTDSEYGPAIKRGKIRFARFNTRNSFYSKIISYACEDSVAALMLYYKYKDQFDGTLIWRTEMGLIPVLVEMESGPIDENGVAQGNMLFNWPVIHRKEAEAKEFAALMAEEILSTLSARLNRVVNINLGSPKQLAEVLYQPAPEGLGLPIKKRSDKTQAPSTSDDALKVIAKSDPIIKQILEYRQVLKLNGSYLSKFIKELSYTPSGTVFPNHNQAGALTGRMSVDQVSYQQWPKPYHFELLSGRTFDLNFRDLFIAPDNFRIVGFDYANVEMRIAGALSGETKITDAFNAGLDLHKSTAAATFKVPFEEVTTQQRDSAKTLNFAILYGSGPENIADMLTTPTNPVSKEDAQQMLDDYLAGYPALANWIKRQQVMAREQKWVSTHFGRKFTVWEHYDHRRWINEKGDRMAVNAPVQGTAADIIKIAMVRCARKIKAAGLEGLVRMTLTVHDALEFLVHDSVETQTVIDLLTPEVSFSIPGFPLEIRADWHEGYQWGAVADISVDERKQITEYSLKYDKKWLPKKFEKQGRTLREVLDEYYQWENQIFGLSAQYYSARHPDFVLWEQEMAQDAPDGAQEPSRPDPEDSLPPASPKEPQVATVTLLDMPTQSSWTTFVRFLEQRPGQDVVRIETPEGPLELDQRYGLTMDDQGELSLIFNGASLSFASTVLDADEILFEEFE